MKTGRGLGQVMQGLVGHREDSLLLGEVRAMEGL